MSVQNVILFISSGSQMCEDPMRMIAHYRMPVNIIRLDTPSDRKRAATGKFFQIHSVPTLAIVYQDGNTQLFVGKDKTLAWFQNLLTKNSQEQQESREPPQMQTSVESYASDAIYPQKRIKPILSKKKKNKKNKKNVTFDDSEENTTPVELEFVDEPQQPRTAGLLVGPTAKKADSGMNDVMKEAARMQAAMKATVKDYKGD